MNDTPNEPSEHGDSSEAGTERKLGPAARAVYSAGAWYTVGKMAAQERAEKVALAVNRAWNRGLDKYGIPKPHTMLMKSRAFMDRVSDTAPARGYVNAWLRAGNAVDSGLEKTGQALNKAPSWAMDKYANGKEGLADRIDSGVARWAALKHAAKRSAQYSKTMMEMAWKQGGVTAPIVVTYGSARSERGSLEYGQAFQFNEIMGAAGWDGRTGAGPGVMEAGSEGMLSAGREPLGINLKLRHEQQANKAVSKPKLTTAKEFPERMEGLRMGARAYVAFRGGVGTLQEYADIVGLMNTGKIPEAPVVFVDTKFWQGTKDQIDAMVADGKVGADLLKNVLFTDSVEEAAQFVLETDARLMREREQSGPAKDSMMTKLSRGLRNAPPGPRQAAGRSSGPAARDDRRQMGQGRSPRERIHAKGKGH